MLIKLNQLRLLRKRFSQFIFFKKGPNLIGTYGRGFLDYELRHQI